MPNVSVCDNPLMINLRTLPKCTAAADFQKQYLAVPKLLLLFSDIQFDDKVIQISNCPSKLVRFKQQVCLSCFQIHYCIFLTFCIFHLGLIHHLSTERKVVRHTTDVLWHSGVYLQIWVLMEWANTPSMIVTKVVLKLIRFLWDL